jgi:hypothetical protein
MGEIALQPRKNGEKETFFTHLLTAFLSSTAAGFFQQFVPITSSTTKLG